MQAYSPRLFGKIYVRTVTYLKRRNVPSLPLEFPMILKRPDTKKSTIY